MIKRLLGESVRGSQKKPAEDEQEAEAEEALTHFEIIVCCEDEPRQSQTESQLRMGQGRGVEGNKGSNSHGVCSGRSRASPQSLGIHLTSRADT